MCRGAGTIFFGRGGQNVDMPIVIAPRLPRPYLCGSPIGLLGVLRLSFVMLPSVLFLLLPLILSIVRLAVFYQNIRRNYISKHYIEAQVLVYVDLIIMWPVVYSFFLPFYVSPLFLVRLVREMYMSVSTHHRPTYRYTYISVMATYVHTYVYIHIHIHTYTHTYIHYILIDWLTDWFTDWLADWLTN